LKAITKGSIIEINGLLLPVWGGKKGKFTHILEAIYHQMNNMLSHHSRVLLVRSDLHLHDYTQNSELLSDFIRKLRKRLKAKYKLTRLGYIWVRERNISNNTKQAQHYHLALMLDGNKVQHPGNIHKLIESIWQNWDQPKPFTPKNSYYKIQRGNQHQFNNAFKRCSYFAKVVTKEDKAPQTNHYSASRIKQRMK